VNAWLLGALCERLHQSAILGYLLAGMLLGPHTLDVVSGGPLECALYYADGFMDPRSPERRTPRVLDTMEGGDGI